MKDDMISRQAAIETVRKAQSIGQAHRMLVQLPSAQPERDDCDTCKHGYFGSVVCNNCRVRYPSYWESREGGQDERM